jgi:hypothetical protein
MAPTATVSLIAGVTVILAAASVPAVGQGSPATSARTIVKCNIEGQTVYTDLPCAEAGRITTELSPKQGDVHPEPHFGALRREVADLGLPIDTRFVVVAGGRNPECPHLEQRMALVAAEGMRTVNDESIRMIDERLTVQRHWHRELGC